MINTRNNKSSAHLIPTIKNNASSCSQKNHSANLRCHNCSNSSKLEHRTNTKSCLKSWVISLNNYSRNQANFFIQSKIIKKNGC